MKAKRHMMVVSVGALASLLVSWAPADAQAQAPATQPGQPAEEARAKATVKQPAKDTINGGIVFPPEKRMWSRIVGRVKVINAYTLVFDDGTEVCLSRA